MGMLFVRDGHDLFNCDGHEVEHELFNRDGHAEFSRDGMASHLCQTLSEG